MNRVSPAIVCIALVAWVITQANIGSDSGIFNLVRSIPWGDKLAHFGLFGMLSGLTIIATKYKVVDCFGRQLPLGAILVLALTVLEEISQLFFINRSFDYLDLVADAAGIYLSILLVNRYKAVIERKLN